MNGDSRDSGRHGESSREHTSSRGGRDHRESYRSRDENRRGDRDGRGDRERRRSRSPGGGGGHRSSRREYEVDTYSSSRDQHTREREDRYRDRRDDTGRDWNRDRAERAEHPRRDRDDRGPPRRERGGDRELFDDRRGGGGGGGDRRGGGGRGGGFGGRGQDRQRSASPPRKPKEPTPDLTDVVPILERKRRLTQWDIKPPGYENVTAEQAKLSGMFPLPGAPRAQAADPARLQALVNQPAGSASNSALKTANARQSKRVFAYDVPAGTTADKLQDFFNMQMNGLNVTSGQDPCISAMLSTDQTFALLEFKTPEDATYALALDGINLDNDGMNGAATNGDKAGGMSMRRPKDYIVPNAPEDDPDAQMGVVSNVVKDGPNKLTITNIPLFLTEENVTELVVSFGDLKSFILVKDVGTDQSKGIAFLEYTDPSNSDMALENLEGMELGDGVIHITRSNTGRLQAAGLEMSVTAMSMLAGATDTASTDSGRVLQLLNMVTGEELMDKEEYEEILEDVEEECRKYGNVLAIKIPRPTGGSRAQSGVGKIFVKYETSEMAKEAMAKLAGKKFAERTVVVTFFGEEYFDVGAW